MMGLRIWVICLILSSFVSAREFPESLETLYRTVADWGRLEHSAEQRKAQYQEVRDEVRVAFFVLTSSDRQQFPVGLGGIPHARLASLNAKFQGLRDLSSSEKSAVCVRLQKVLVQTEFNTRLPLMDLKNQVSEYFEWIRISGLRTARAPSQEKDLSATLYERRPKTHFSCASWLVSLASGLGIAGTAGLGYLIFDSTASDEVTLENAETAQGRASREKSRQALLELIEDRGRWGMASPETQAQALKILVQRYLEHSEPNERELLAGLAERIIAAVQAKQITVPEGYSPAHPSSQFRRLLELTEKRGLIESGFLDDAALWILRKPDQPKVLRAQLVPFVLRKRTWETLTPELRSILDRALFDFAVAPGSVQEWKYESSAIRDRNGFEILEQLLLDDKVKAATLARWIQHWENQPGFSEAVAGEARKLAAYEQLRASLREALFRD